MAADDMEKPRPWREPSTSAETGPGPHPVENVILPAPNNQNSEKKNEEAEEDYVAITGSSDEETDEPPDGGLTAWLQVLGCYFLFFNSWCVSVNPFTLLPFCTEERLFRPYQDDGPSIPTKLATCGA